MTNSAVPWRVAILMSAALHATAGAAGPIAGNLVPTQKLSETDWSGIRRAFAAAQRTIKDASGRFEADNPGQQWRVCFDGTGFTVRPRTGDWSWGLQLSSYGFAGCEVCIDSPARIAAEGDKIAFRHSDQITEWFINRHCGLEHGYTIHDRPPARRMNSPFVRPTEVNALRLALVIHGDLSPQVDNAGRDVRFLDSSGAVKLRYGGLAVFDANGVSVPAWFDSADGQLAVVLLEAGATYPLTIDPLAQQAYLKPSNTGGGDQFGNSVAISGNTVVVGAFGEDSDAAGVDGSPANNSFASAGAAYVFVRNGTTWSQQAYLKASNPDPNDLFGYSVAISGDTIVVGAFMEDSSDSGVDGDQSDNGTMDSGAAYVFVRNGTTWSQQAYLKASNTGMGDWFGWPVAISGDTVVVGAFREGSIATGVNGDQGDNSAWSAGAAYVYVRNGTSWSQQAYLKASNTELHDEFAHSLAISGDTIVVGAPDEDCSSTGVNGNQTNNNAQSSGAAFVFVRNGSTWNQQAYLKASNTGVEDFFGISVAVSGDTVVVGSFMEDSSAAGVNGNQNNNNAMDSGAAYIFVRNGNAWAQQAYLKASNTGEGDQFGISAAVEGEFALVGALAEDCIATGVNGVQDDENARDSGATYVFKRDGTFWIQQAYLKASNTGAGDFFGESVSISEDVILVGARHEDSTAKGVNGNQGSNGASDAGAVYVFTGLESCQSDADGDGICDEEDVCPGFDDTVDTDGDGIPDGCESPDDITGDGIVDGDDLALLLAAWGQCSGCAADIDGDGVVDGADLGSLLAAWTG